MILAFTHGCYEWELLHARQLNTHAKMIPTVLNLSGPP